MLFHLLFFEFVTRGTCLFHDPPYIALVVMALAASDVQDFAQFLIQNRFSLRGELFLVALQTLRTSGAPLALPQLVQA